MFPHYQIRHEFIIRIFLSLATISRADSMQPYDVTVSRSENQGFGFVIISSVNRSGSTIGTYN